MDMADDIKKVWKNGFREFEDSESDSVWTNSPSQFIHYLCENPGIHLLEFL